MRREFEFLIEVFHFRNKLKLPEDAFDEEGREIREEYHELEEQAWRRKHAESVRRMKLKEKEERLALSKVTNVDLNKKIEEYEMMEELANELEAMDIVDDEKLAGILSGEIQIPQSKPRVAYNLGSSPLVIQAINGNATESELLTAVKESQEPNETSQRNAEINNDLITQSNQEIVDLLKTYRSKIKDVLKNVRKDDERSLNLFLDLIELKDDIEDDIRKMNDDAEYSESEKDSDDETTVSLEADHASTRRKVRFSTSLEDVKLIENKEHYHNDLPSDNHTIPIHFEHSDARFTGLSTPSDVIAHPGEIHKVFTPSTPATKSATKSILKHRHTSDLTSPEELRPPKKVFHSEFQAIGDVREHSKMEVTEIENVVEIAAKDEPSKKISKFRQMRLKS